MLTLSTPVPRISFALATVIGFFLTAHPVFATDLSGHWQGNWSSDSTGHRGPLRCTLTRLDETTYQADFSGRFFKLIPFRYSVVLTVTSDDGHTVHLSGSHVLGRRLGTFTYTAQATCDEFVANYESCKDCGQFILSRCCW
jgi:hypothetical protein